MRKPCKTKRCSNLAVAGGAYCLTCRRRRRRQRAGYSVCKDWSIYVVPNSPDRSHVQSAVAPASLGGDVGDPEVTAVALRETTLTGSG